MPDKLGEVYYEAHIRGDKLPAEAKRIGKNTGTVLGDEMGKATDSELIASLNKNGKRWAANLEAKGTSITSAFRKSFKQGLDRLSVDMAKVFSTNSGIEDFIVKSDDAGEAVKRLSGNVGLLYERNKITKAQFDSFNGSIREYVAGHNELATSLQRETQLQQDASRARADSLDGLRQLVREQSNAHAISKTENVELEKKVSLFERLTSPIKKYTRSQNEGAAATQRYTQRLREWQVITLLITAAAPEIAVLGSAVGAGLTVVAGAALAGVVGLGLFAASLKGLGSELSELPVGIRPAAQAFQDFKKSLGEVQDSIQLASAGGLTSIFQTLQAVLVGLTPALSSFAAVVSTTFATILAGVAPGTAGFEKLNTLVEGMAPIFASLATGVGSLLGGLGNVFITALPFVQRFVDYLGELFDRFLQWTGSVEGATAVNGWFQNMEKVFSGVAEVAGSLGKVLADIVTPSLASDFSSFLGQLADFLPVVGSLIEVVEKLDIFGILGAIFEELGPVLDALLVPLGELAAAIGGSLIYAIQLLAPFLMQLVEQLTPIITIIAEKMTPYIGLLAESFITLLPPILQLVGILLDALLPILLPLTDLMILMIATGIEPLGQAMDILGQVFDKVAPIIQFLGDLVGAVIQTIVAAITGDFSTIGAVWENVWNSMGNVLKSIWNGILTTIENGINGAIDLINGLIKGINDAGDALGITLTALPKVKIPKLASGGMITHRMQAIIGEAGPEAVVPLRRNLSQVDPAVRDLSAYAQGLTPASNGTGKSVVIQSGAIQIITPAKNPAIVASMVMDDVVARALN